ACGAAIVSDNWPGLDTFFSPGAEILLPLTSDDVARYVSGYSNCELQAIGRAARERVLASHSNTRRAREFEQAVEIASGRKLDSRIAVV
ncbi:MAG: glycosyltransferase, partial [Actinomycetota bacterium]